MKLYDKYKHENLPIAKEEITIDENNSISLDSDIIELNKSIYNFDSLTNVESSLILEDFKLDNANYIIYNEYIKSISKNLGIYNVTLISKEDLNTNKEISLEGFIGDIWTKIKELFKRIYNSIKDFFNKYFTRLGRLKNKLKNLDEVLGEIDKDLQKVELDSIPSDLANKYPYGDELTSTIIESVFANTVSIISSLDDITKEANSFINKDLIDRDFVKSIRDNIEIIKSKKNKINKNEANKKAGSVFNEAKFGEAGEHNMKQTLKLKKLKKNLKNLLIL